ncbi:30S ribosomal protein S6 [Candidatus Gracilibacteria bacterium]|nr:30S ribosomal protein S6 [Candidatus Gracilibacteria bacterium]
MQKYEVLAIIINSLDSKKAADQAKTSISSHIKELGGNVVFEDFWGERGFAYKINGEKWGYYFLAQFELDRDKITELKKDWNIDKNLVRFLITKVEAHMGEPRKYEELKKEWESTEKERKISEMGKVSTKKAIKVADVAEKEEIKEPPVEKKEELIKEKVKETTVKKEAVPTKPLEKEKESPAEKKDIIDKKLDEILEDSSLDL